MAEDTRQADRDLARRACLGEAGAWDEIVDLYGGRIYNLALQFAHERAQAEDLTQEVFLRLFRNLSKYRGDVPLVAWTLRLSRNLCIDHYRRGRRERESVFLSESALETLTSDSDPAREAQRREALSQIDAVLPRMRDELALVVVLRDLQGLSYTEISALLDLPIGTLKSRLSRGRRDLVSRLQALGNRRENASLHPGKSVLGVAPC